MSFQNRKHKLEGEKSVNFIESLILSFSYSFSRPLPIITNSTHSRYTRRSVFLYQRPSDRRSLITKLMLTSFLRDYFFTLKFVEQIKKHFLSIHKFMKSHPSCLHAVGEKIVIPGKNKVSKSPC